MNKRKRPPDEWPWSEAEHNGEASGVIIAAILIAVFLMVAIHS